MPNVRLYFYNHIIINWTFVDFFHPLQATQPRLFLDFIDQLLEIVSKVNIGVDRILRGTACECLKEIETLHPVSHMKWVLHLKSTLKTWWATQDPKIDYFSPIRCGQNIIRSGWDGANKFYCLAYVEAEANNWHYGPGAPKTLPHRISSFIGGVW